MLTEEEVVKAINESGCIGTVKMSFESGPYCIDRPTINASRFAEAIESAATAPLIAQIEPFATYLKDGETPIERFERERKDNAALLGLLAKDRERIAELEKRCAELEKDAERLDWMIFYSAKLKHSNDAEYCTVLWVGDDGDWTETDLHTYARAAIDSAMSGQEKA